MNIKTIILAAGLLSPVALTTSCTPYMGLVGRQESGLVTLTRALSNVHDQASADAAAQAVNNYGGLLMSDVSALFKNGKPSIFELLLLKNSYQNSNIKEQSKSCLSEAIRVGSQGFYGSTALRDSFIHMLSSGR